MFVSKSRFRVKSEKDGDTYKKPLRTNIGHRPDVLLGGEHELIVDDPVVRARHRRAGMDHNKLVVLDRLVHLAVAALAHGNLHEEASQKRAADVGVVVLVLERRADQVNVVRLHNTLELGPDVVGARQVAVREEMLVAPTLHVLAVGLGALVGVVGVEQRQVVAVGVGKLHLHLVGTLARVVGAHPYRGDGEKGYDGEDLVRAVELGRRDKHNGKGGVERELGGHTTEARKLTIVVQAGEVVELLQGAHHGLGRRRVHEIEMYQVLDTKLLQLQNSVGQVRPENFRVSLLNKLLLESLLGVKTEAFTGPCTTGTTSSLLSRGLRNRRNQQGLDTRAGVVNLLLAETGVDDVDDTIDCQGRFGNVGRDNDLATRPATLAQGLGSLFENALLVRRRESAVKRVDLHGASIRLANHIVHLQADSPASILNLLLTGKEEQDISLGLGGMNLQHGPYGGLEVVTLGLGGIEDLDGEGTTRDGEQWGVVEVGLELLGIEGGRHDNDLEVFAAGGDLLEQGHEDIGREGTFVGFIENDAAVAGHVVVVHGLAQELTIGHVLEHGLGAGPVLETDAVTDFLAQLDIQLVRDTLGNRHGRHSSGLGTGDELAVRVGELVVEDVLGNLGGLSGTRLTDEDEDLGVVVHVEELLALLVDGEVAPRLEDVEVSLRVRLASPRVELRVLGLGSLDSGGIVSLEGVEGRFKVAIVAVAVAVAVLVKVGEIGVVLFGGNITVLGALDALRVLAVVLHVGSLDAFVVVAGHCSTDCRGQQAFYRVSEWEVLRQTEGEGREAAIGKWEGGVSIMAPPVAVMNSEIKWRAVGRQAESSLPVCEATTFFCLSERPDWGSSWQQGRLANGKDQR